MVTMKPYPAPTAPVDAEVTIKYSRFIAALRPVTTREEARTALAEIQARYPDATHHCYAQLLGSPDSGEASISDDGEPSGTAGRPIFTVIGYKGVGDVLVVVTRYYGGVKLGAGGLIRAYMTAAEAVLSQMKVTSRAPQVFMTVCAGFADEQAIRYFCAGHGGAVTEVRYGEGIEVDLTIDAAAVAALEEFCAERGLALRPPLP